MKFLLIIIGLIVSLSVAVLLGAWATSTLWGWFIVPVFGLPELSYVQAFGFALIVSYLTKTVKVKDKTKDGLEAYIEDISVSIVYPIISVGMGWVAVQFL